MKLIEYPIMAKYNNEGFLEINMLKIDVNNNGVFELIVKNFKTDIKIDEQNQTSESSTNQPLTNVMTLVRISKFINNSEKGILKLRAMFESVSELEDFMKINGYEEIDLLKEFK